MSFVCTLGGEITRKSLKTVGIRLHEFSREDFTIYFSDSDKIYHDKSLILYFDGKVFDKTLDDIVSLYKKYGKNFIKILNGEYRFVIYDIRNSRIFLITDSRSTRKVYICKSKGNLFASSHIKPLLLLLDDYTLNQDGMIEFMVFGIPISPHTMFNEVIQLEANEIFEMNSKKSTSFMSTFKKENSDNIFKKIFCAYKYAVKDRVNPENRIGIWLSGGVDSSVLAILVSYFANNVRTYTLSYLEESINEGIYARKISDDLGFPNKKVSIKSDVIKKAPLISWIEEMPHQSVRAFLNFKLAEATSNEDATFLGDGIENTYLYGPSYRIAEILSMLGVSSKFYDPIKWWVDQRGISKFYFLINNQTKNKLNSINPKNFLVQYNSIKQRTWEFEYIPTFQKYYDLASSQSFYPFIDDRVFSFMNLPASVRRNRRIFEQSFKDILPVFVLKRKKVPLVAPSKIWLSQQQEMLTGAFQQFAERDILDRILLSQYLNSRFPLWDRRRWSLFSLEIFLQTFFDDNMSKKF